MIVPTVWSSIVNFFAMFDHSFLCRNLLPDTFAGIHLKARSVYFENNVSSPVSFLFTYSFAALYGLMTLHDWLNHLEAVKQVALLGYEVVASHQYGFHISGYYNSFHRDICRRGEGKGRTGLDYLGVSGNRIIDK